MPVQQTTVRWAVNPDGSKVRYSPPPASDYATPRTHAEADAQAEERGITFPDDVKTVKQKADYLGADRSI